MEKDLEKLINEISSSRAVLEVENKEDIPEKNYLKALNEKVGSLGYEVTRTLKDVNNRGIYHIYIEKQENYDA